jgi:hypothetical protein
MAEEGEKTDLQTHAWCLVSDHFHLIAKAQRIAQEELSTLGWTT